MCGLVGMAGGNITHQDKVALKWLMYLDAMRGEDSTGLALINNKNEVVVHKELGRPDNLWLNEEVFSNGVVKNTDVKVFIGHNRAATIGKVDIHNAHPFKHGEVVGAHNGTLKGVFRLPDWKEFGTDSEAIIYNFSNEDDVDKVVGKLDGAYALTWWDGYTHTLNFIRNYERTLFYTRRKDRDVIYWASTEWLLQLALGKARISYEPIQEFTEDHHYSLDMSGKKEDFKKVELVNNGKMEGYKYTPSFQNYQRFGHPFHQQTPNKNLSQSEKEKDRKEFEKWEGKEVEFLVGEVKTGLTGSEYLEGVVTNGNEDLEIRIYNQNLPIFKKMKEGNCYFVCTIKKAVILYVKGKTEYYLLPDNRTIQEAAQSNILPFKKDTDKNYIGFNNVAMTIDEWTAATRHGCCYCSSSVEPWHHHKVDWLTNEEFLCPDCVKNKFATQMAAQIYGYVG